ncbi:hypothetical protein [Streptomyces griseorubiginosus]|uniref:hypothetical protein n=1 Tax=Streptomyces griseorubiginosus TaxID=67304 RepID=UPI0036F172D7
MPAERFPARQTATTVKAGFAAAAVHAGLWLTIPVLAVILTMLEAALTATVVLTALYGPNSNSDRAFRMLPWATPPTPRQKAPDSRTG